MESKKANAKKIGDELEALMLKKANLTKKDIYEAAITTWINKNLDLLSPAERLKYKSVLR